MSAALFEPMKDQILQAVEKSAPELEVVFRPMFGGICAYVNGRVFASLSDVGLALKLPPGAQDELLKQEGAKLLQYEPDSPPSKHYVILPTPLRSDIQALAAWTERSIDYVSSLPAPRSKRRRTE